MIFDKINEGIKTSLKHGLTTRLSVLRGLKSACINTAIQTKKESLTDIEVSAIIQKQINQRKDSIEQFRTGGRNELAEKEKIEINFLLEYLPKQMSEEDLDNIICSTIVELQASTKKDMGKVIKSVIEKTNGQADNKRISALISTKLN